MPWGLPMNCGMATIPVYSPEGSVLFIRYELAASSPVGSMVIYCHVGMQTEGHSPYSTIQCTLGTIEQPHIPIGLLLFQKKLLGFDLGNLGTGGKHAATNSATPATDHR